LPPHPTTLSPPLPGPPVWPTAYAEKRRQNEGTGTPANTRKPQATRNMLSQLVERIMYAGISWDAIGYQVAVVDQSCEEVISPLRFHADNFDSMIDFLRRESREVVIDSTNGLLDGMLIDAGLTVYRAALRKPEERGLINSIPATVLAAESVSGRSLLTRLESGQGTHLGRDQAISDGFQAGVAAVNDQPGPGRFVAHDLRTSPTVALTFDDGHCTPNTDQILDMQSYHRVPATFFCAVIQAIYHAGHTRRILCEGSALGNHTKSLTLQVDMSIPQLDENLRRTGDVLASA